MESVNSVRWVG